MFDLSLCYRLDISLYHFQNISFLPNLPIVENYVGQIVMFEKKLITDLGSVFRINGAIVFIRSTSFPVGQYSSPGSRISQMEGDGMGND